MAISQSLSKRLSIVIFRSAMVSVLLGTMLACSSSSTRSTGAHYNTHSYDSYYRTGINSHHHRNYRYTRPVRRPVRRPVAHCAVPSPLHGRHTLTVRTAVLLAGAWVLKGVQRGPAVDPRDPFILPRDYGQIFFTN